MRRVTTSCPECGTPVSGWWHHRQKYCHAPCRNARNNRVRREATLRRQDARRLGIFYVSRFYLRRSMTESQVAQLFRAATVLHCCWRPHEDRIKYWAISPLFRPMSHRAIEQGYFPLYKMVFHQDGTLSARLFEPKERKESLLWHASTSSRNLPTTSHPAPRPLPSAYIGQHTGAQP